MGNKLIDMCAETLELAGVTKQVDRIIEHTKLFRPFSLGCFSRGERLEVETQHSLYGIGLVDPETYLVNVEGGEYFGSQRETKFLGATFGPEREEEDFVVVTGCFIRGMGMVFPSSDGERNIVTTPIKLIVAYDVNGDLIDHIARRDAYGDRN